MKFSTFRALLGVAFLLSCGGCILSFWGNQESKLSEKASAEPVTVNLSRLEAGDPLPDYHIAIGPHFACYYSTVYSYREKKNEKKEVGPDTQITYAMYPIVSAEHPQAQALEKLEKKLGGADKGHDEEEIPVIKNFAILVKTERFKKVGDIPEDVLIRREESVRGMVINEIRSLDTQERKLIQEEFPDLDVKKILILEEGRTPSAATTSWAAIGGGIILAVLGVFTGIVATLWFLISLMSGRR